MAEQMDKAKILDGMRTKYAALEDILAPLDEPQMTTEGVNGDWSIKDVLAHISAWHLRLLDRLHAATWNEEPTLSGVVTDEEVARLNEQFYKENKSRPLHDVLTDFRTTYLQIVDVVQAMNEEDLIDPHRFAWMRGNPLWYIIAGDTYEHYQEHTATIQQWLGKTKQD